MAKETLHSLIHSIRQLANKNLANAIQFDNCQYARDCVGCIKNSEIPYPEEAEHIAKHPLHFVHSDLCGWMKTQSVSGNYYFLTFVEDYSRYSMIYFLLKKNKVLSKFGRTIKVLRSDKGGEYIGKELKDSLKDQGNLSLSFTD
ncbi:retrovirus-related Pol polyprotein from transposon TNT 1-94 [Nephila pilipes]|uniref:Retrovirus-related Pol polyprotein from transposon TNT 1-94 n=1 Tax=Nephila pilipes TaxID=299642 RepID=A0A8X6R937_NEPPI|nr:retrovirus-related Pol polyprotein from transposon TNT 1-94 [Nephila pilipes]